MRTAPIYYHIIAIFLSVAPCFAALEVSSPTSDTILMDPAVNFQGTITSNPAAMISIKVGSDPPVVKAAIAGRWAINVKLSPGLNAVAVSAPGEPDKRLNFTVGKGIVKRPSQKVRFVWDADVNAQLRAIATGTLDRKLEPSDLDAFITGVRTQTVAAFLRAYSGIDVEMVEQDGPDVHTIHMLNNSGDIFGQSFFDCGNQELHQESEIWVGTYKDAMVKTFDEWKPMKRDDSLQTRIVDVGEALGRTSAHEGGHSFGLVGSGSACEWMRGCDSGHNCDQMDLDYSVFGVHRFNRGFFVMDPGGKTVNNARIAEPSPVSRSATRTPARFNTFNRSYFSIVHPK